MQPLSLIIQAQLSAHSKNKNKNKTKFQSPLCRLILSALYFTKSIKYDRFLYIHYFFNSAGLSPALSAFISQR